MCIVLDNPDETRSNSSQLNQTDQTDHCTDRADISFPFQTVGNQSSIKSFLKKVDVLKLTIFCFCRLLLLQALLWLLELSSCSLRLFGLAPWTGSPQVAESYLGR